MQTPQIFTKKDWNNHIKINDYLNDYRHRYNIVYTKEFIHVLYNLTRDDNLYMECNEDVHLYKLISKDVDAISQELLSRIVLFDRINSPVTDEGLIFIETLTDEMLEYVCENNFSLIIRMNGEHPDQEEKLLSTYYEVGAGILLNNAATDFTNHKNFQWKMFIKKGKSTFTTYKPNVLDVVHNTVRKSPLKAYKSKNQQEPYKSKLKGFRDRLRQRAIAVSQNNFRLV